MTHQTFAGFSTEHLKCVLHQAFCETVYSRLRRSEKGKAGLLSIWHGQSPSTCVLAAAAAEASHVKSVIETRCPQICSCISIHTSQPRHTGGDAELLPCPDDHRAIMMDIVPHADA